ncbi:uncharacterized protein LOC143454932 isoform X1 [Clavelina lepadiformis]|uniref:uncharacterized protein LOC143454932 isoform X1 n=1 Tax=Clavelina lepadiformis TaxID=159417 RepID=UPI0040431A3D
MLDSHLYNAEYLIRCAKHCSRAQKHNVSYPSKWRSLHSQLQDVYEQDIVEENNSADEPLLKRLRLSSNPLWKLCSEDKSLNRVIINLFPSDNGYSLMLKHSRGHYVETVQLPYDEYEFLEYIDNEQIPPLLIQILCESEVNMFYSGCIIAEIRDYRIATTSSNFETRFVLLKPTQQTLLGDVNEIAAETAHSFRWGNDDKLALESYLVLATAEPLCLDPSPTVQVLKNLLDDRKRTFKTHAVKRTVRRNGVNAVCRRKAHSKLPAPDHLKLFDFLQKKKAQKEKNQSTSTDIRLPKDAVDLWRKSPLELSFPSSDIDVQSYAKALTPRPPLNESELLEVQQVHLKSEGPNRDIYSLISILQRPSDMHYFGKLQSNKYFQQNADSSKDVSSSCRFSLGTEHRANLYILQYQELFAEDGRRPATITVARPLQQQTKYQIPLVQQPWQLEQDKSLYSVRSVNSIPLKHWNMFRVNENSPKSIQQSLSASQGQQTLPSQTNQPTTSAQGSTTTNTAITTPTLNTITLQPSSQSAFVFPIPARQASQQSGVTTPSPHLVQGSSHRILGQRLSSDFHSVLSAGLDNGNFKIQDSTPSGRLSRPNSAQDVFTFDSQSGLQLSDSNATAVEESNTTSNNALIQTLDSALHALNQGASVNLHGQVKRNSSGQQQVHAQAATQGVTIATGIRDQQQMTVPLQSTTPGTVTLRMPVKVANRAQQLHAQAKQATAPLQTTNQQGNVQQQQQPTQGTVLRMPVSLSNTIRGQQITAAINLLGSSGRNVLTSQGSILGNIQLPSGSRGTMQLPASISMQLTGDANQVNQDNKSISAATAPQQYTIVTSGISSSEPLTIVTNNMADVAGAAKLAQPEQQFRAVAGNRSQQQLVQLNKQQNKPTTLTYNPRTQMLTANVGVTNLQQPVQLLQVDSNTLQQLPIRMAGQQVMLNTVRSTAADQTSTSQKPLSQQLQQLAANTSAGASNVRRGRKRKTTPNQMN